MTRRPRILRCLFSLLLLAALSLSCTRGMIRNEMQQVLGTNPISREELLLMLINYYDDYIARIEQATDAIEATSSDPHRRLMVHSAKYYPSTSLLWIISSPKENESLLNVLVMVTLERMVWEGPMGEEMLGDQADTLRAAQREMEAEAWRVAGRVLNRQQQAELRTLIEDWRRENPNQVYVSTVRLSDLNSGRRTGVVSGLLGALSAIQPLSGTTKEVEEARLFGERALFVSARMPLIIQWQTELMTYDFATQPEARELRAGGEALTATSLTARNLMTDLPRLVAEERKNAIEDLRSAIEQERTALLAALDERTGEAANLTGNVRDAVREAGAMLPQVQGIASSVERITSASIQLTGSVDGTLGRIQSMQGSGSPSDKASPSLDEIVEAIEKLNAATVDLNRLIDSTDHLLASKELDKRVGTIQQAADATVDRVYTRLIWAILAFWAGALAFLLAWRLVPARKS